MDVATLPASNECVIFHARAKVFRELKMRAESAEYECEKCGRRVCDQRISELESSHYIISSTRIKYFPHRGSGTSSYTSTATTDIGGAISCKEFISVTNDSDWND